MAFVRPILLASLSFFILPAYAGSTDIQDPNHIWEQMDQFQADTSFAKAFTCGDSATFNNFIDSCNFACQDGFCFDQCGGQQKSVTNTVANCSPTQISIYSDDGSSTDISKDSFIALHGDLGRPFLAGLNDRIGYSGVLTLTSSKARTFAVDPKNPQNGSWPALDVEASYVIPNHSPIPVEITMIKGGLGVAQLVSFRVNNQTWFRLSAQANGAAK